jgi:hypothetical protein
MTTARAYERLEKARAALSRVTRVLYADVPADAG